MAITSINLGKIKFNWKGAWAPTTVYVKDDVVRYSGSSYVCVTGHQSQATFSADSSKWELMAEGTTPTTTEGDLIYRGVSQDQRLPIGTEGQVLTVDGGIPAWRDNGVEGKIYYVSTEGNDSNNGLSWASAFRTIKYACTQITGPATLYVASGTFSEELPIIVPPFTAVVGDSIRTTIVQPASGFEQATMWKLSDGTILNKLHFIGLTGFVPYAPNDQDIENSTIGGVYVGFNELSPILTKSPYVLECTAKSSGAIGAWVDGSAHASGYRSMVFHGYTVIIDDGVGFWISDNGRSEIVSCFTYYCHLGYVASSGGKIRALNGNNSYGTYGALASGFNVTETTLNGTLYGDLLEYTPVSLAGGSFVTGQTITGQTSGATGTVVNVQGASNKLYYKKTSVDPFQEGETISNGLGVTATIKTGGLTGQKGFILIVTGLTHEPKPGGSIEFTTGDTGTYVIQSVSDWVNSSSNAVIVLAGEKTVASADGVNIKIRYDYSNIRLTGHDFLNIGTGGVATTNYPGLPFTPPAQGNEVIELFPARVFYVSTDQDGNFRVGEYFKVDQATGRATLNASAFDLSGLTSLRLGSIGAQLGEQINEFSADVTLSGNSNLAVPTERAVKQYFTQVSSNILPSVSNLYTVGSSTLLYDKVYTNKVIGPSTLILDPAAEGNDTGTVQIRGNLQVDGTTTTINSTTLTVDDKNIVLGSGAANDVAADGSGITVESGDGNKTFNWVNATDAFTSSENLDIASGRAYHINGTSILSSTTLGSSVVNSSLTSVGTLTSLTVSGTVAANGSGGITTTETGTVPIFNTNATGINLGGAATTVNIGAAGGGGVLTLKNDNVFIDGDLQVKGDDITTNKTTINVFNTTATTVNFAGAGTTVSIGASTGTTTVNNDLNLQNTKVYRVNSSEVLSRSKLTLNGSVSGTVAFQAASAAGSVTYTLPSADGSNGNALVTNGSGTLSWTAVGAAITDDTSTNATYYPTFATATSGTLSGVRVSSSKCTFNPSTGTLTATIITSSSDARLKENIRPIENALAKVLELSGVLYNRIGSSTVEIGGIAQDFERIVPELVITDAEGMKSIAYGNTVALLIEAIKEQQSQIEEIKRKLV